MGWILIVIGVAGEGIFEVLVSRADALAHTFDEILLTEARKQAGDAKTSAERAALAASHAEGSATFANEAAGRAKNKANAAATLAQESLDVFQTAQFLNRGRVVADPKGLTEELKQYKGKSVILVSYIADQEGWSLCTQLWSIAQSAGMNPVNRCGDLQLTNPLIMPFEVAGPDVDESLKIGGMISTFGKLGVSSGAKADTLTIFVGARSPVTVGRRTPAKKEKNKNQAAKP